MRPRLVARCLLGSLVLVLSCQSAPDISDDIATFGDLFNASVSERCECPQELGHETIEECDAALGGVDVDERACIADALEGEEEAAESYFGCANNALADYVACLEGNAGCVEDWNPNCTSVYEAARSSCGELPAETMAAFNSCLS